MCGRFTYLFSWAQLRALMRLLACPQDELFPRYNVAPTQPAPIIRLDPRGQREGAMLRWGLIPSWAKDASIAAGTINARAESLFEKPAFKSAARARRCIVPISGFYEWQSIPGSRLTSPHWIGRADRSPLWLAGVWDRWQGGQTPLDTFSIITTTPNDLMGRVHDRMPAILLESDLDPWLDPQTSQDEAAALLRPYQPQDLVMYPVGRAINTPRPDDPSLMAPVDRPPPQPGLFE